MRRRIGVMIVAVVWLAAFAVPANAVEPEEPAPTTAGEVAQDEPSPLPRPGTDKLARDSWIVMLERGANPRAAAPGLAKKAGGSVGQVYSHAIKGFQFKGSAKGAAALRKNPNVLSVTPDHAVYVAETDPFGIERIDAFIVGGGDAYSAGYRGAGARIAVIDTGIDLDHPDLAESIDTDAGLNCFDAEVSPNDGHGHGTHVAGTAAAPLNDIGVVGVAPEATLVPIKVFDDAGNSSEALVLCGVDRIVALNTDASSANDIDVANMSWGDPRQWGSCVDDPLHASICAADALGIVLVGGAGNNASNAGTFVPAAFPEVISVSAIADFDGDPGGLAGCQFILTLLANQCDDAFAVFSNYGPSVDVTAPGVNVNSTYAGGGYKTEHGTSMAAPHVSGVAALMKAIDPTLTTAQALTILRQTGELSDGNSAASGCASATQWSGDPDGVAEPLVNALRAAQRAANQSGGALPEVSLSPAGGSNINGVVTLSATATDPSGVASVQFLVDGASVGTDTSAPYSVDWDTWSTFEGSHTITARANATSGTYRCVANAVTTGLGNQGTWVGTYGADGYALGGWNGPTTSDLVVLPNATLTMEQGFRYNWAIPATTTTDVRALQSPDATERRATGWYHGTQLRLRLDFSAAYTGTLHVYGFDWENAGRRMSITVTDGTTTKTVPVTTSFQQGVWIHFPVSVPAGGFVRVTANKTAANNAVIAGLFLGGAGAPPTPTPSPTPTPTPSPTPTPPPYETGVKGSWVGTYGADGYALGGWNGPTTSDLVVLPNATLTMEQGFRYNWAIPATTTTDVRALQSPDATERRATGWYHGTQLRLRLDFSAAYTGTLHVYGFDWENAGRRMSITVTDGTTTKTVPVTTSFQQGVWIHFPVSVPAGGFVRVTANKTAANNAVIAGLFLGGAGAPPTPTPSPTPTPTPSPTPTPPPTPQPTPTPTPTPSPTPSPSPSPTPPPYEPGVQGDWVGTYGVDGYALGGWTGPATGDLAVLPNATLTMEQGFRYNWAIPANTTTDVRALEAPDQSERRATGWYHGTQLRLRLDFSAAYTGTLHVYGFDWETTKRRMNVTVTDGTTSRTVNITTNFRNGAWMHFPVSVPAGGFVRITANRTAGSNAVIAGLFLGGSGTPPTPQPTPTPTPTPSPTPSPSPSPTPPPYEPGVQGDWVGTYGVDGYALGGWTGPATGDLAVLPNATLTMEQGFRYNWAIPANTTTDVRALEAPDQSERRATGWYHGTQLRLRLDFSAAYTGTLHVYGFDWETTKRRMNVTVTDGTTSRTVNITTNFRNGAWMHFPVSVPAGGFVRITANRTAGSNAVIAGLFLGGSGTP